MKDISDNPLVSVIVPFLNGSDWLIEALESVINQSYQNWEIIVMDDGSDKEHSLLAKQFCSNKRNIIYSDHPGHVNKGVTISRNTASGFCRGSLIAFLDADDCWLPNKLMNQVGLFRLFPAVQMICEASLFWYSWNNSAERDTIKLVGAVPDKLYYPPELIKQLYPLGAGAAPCPSGIIIRKDAFIRSGGFEPAFSGIYQLYEDQAFVAKIYLNEIIYLSGDANNRYRKRPNSMSSAGHDKHRYETVREFYLSWLESYLNRQHIRDAEINKLIAMARDEMNR